MLRNKEDAQLVCPISYDDPSQLWSSIEEALVAKFPLKDVTWRSPISTSQITIDRLPLRCVPAHASLFKDTDHPFRWFLAPYIHIFVLSCESADSYKSIKSKLKQWVESRISQRKSWLIVYLPSGSHTFETYQKIFGKISSDCHQDRSGDRTCIVYTKVCQIKSGSGTAPSLQTGIAELVSKIKEGVVASFQLRCVSYDAEIRRLDALRGTPEMEFRQLFLVKESLALMFQMMQLPGESLVQYEELEMLLSSGILTNLAENLWPLVPADVGAAAKTKTRSSISGRLGDAESEPAPESGEEGGAVDGGKERGSSAHSTPVWTSACQQGEAVLLYSINASRMKVLKNKVSVLELNHYVFARECFFLFGLNRLSLCAEKGLVFIQSILTQWAKVNASSPPALTGMVNLWAVVAAVHIARGCRQNVLSSVTKAASVAAAMTASQGSSESPVNSPGLDRKRGPQSTSSGSAGTIDSAAMTRAIDDTLAMRIRDSAKYLSDLLMFAKKRLVHLLPSQKGSFPHFRSVAIRATEAFLGWESYGDVLEGFPEIFNSEESEAVGKEEGKLETEGSFLARSPERSNRSNRQRLFSDGIDNMEDSASEFCKKLHRLVSLLAETSECPGDEVTVERRSELAQLEATVCVTLTRLQAEHFEIAGRWRFASCAKIECADMLMARGKFSLARVYLRSALESTALVPLLVTSLVQVPTTETVSLWGNLRVWALRKCLLCARAMGDAYDYVSICLSLLEPACAKGGYLAPELRSALQADILLLAAQLTRSEISGTDDGVDKHGTPEPSLAVIDPYKLLNKPSSSLFMRNEIVVEATKHFGAAIHVNCPVGLQADMVVPALPPLEVTTSTKLIHDESFKIRVAKCEAGRSCWVYLYMCSEFPDTLPVDSITVTYTPFVPPMMAGASSLQSSGGSAAAISSGGHNVGSSQTISGRPQGSFDCRPAEACLDEWGKIAIRPGEQAIPLLFQPPACGEYVLHGIVIRLGGVFFVQSVVSDVNKLHPYFSTNVIVSVTPPAEALTLRAFAPVFSPVDQTDSIGLRITAEPGDVIESLFVRAWSKLDGTADLNDENGRAAAMSTPARSAIGNEHGAATVELGPPKNWTIGGFSTEPEISIDLKQDGMRINKFPVATGANIIVPFKTISAPMCSSQDDSSIQSSFLLTFFAEGTVTRNGCTFDFELSASCCTVVGVGLSFRQISTELFGDEYFSQVIVTNISSIAWTLQPLSALSLLATSTSDRFVLASGMSGAEEIVPQEGVVLHPKESYYAGIHMALAATGSSAGGKSDSSGVLPLELVFPARRACAAMDNRSEVQCQGRADLDSAWCTQTLEHFDKTIFETVVSIKPPAIARGALSCAGAIDCKVSVEVEQMANRHAVVGEPVLCTYVLEMVYPSMVSGTEATRLTVGVGLSQPGGGQWMAVGTMQKEVQISPEDNCLSLGLRLIPLRAGSLALPPLQLGVINPLKSGAQRSVVDVISVFPSEQLCIFPANRYQIIAHCIQ